MRLPAIFTRPVLAALLVAALGLHLATLTVAPVFAALSDAVAAVAGETRTVRGQQAAERARADAARAAMVSRTADEVRARVARTAARGSATALVEAVPLLGGGAAAASVALDIADACATARDLHRLELYLVPGTDPDFDCRDSIGGTLDDGTMKSLMTQFRNAPQIVCASARDYAEAASLSDLPGWVADAISGLARACPK